MGIRSSLRRILVFQKPVSWQLIYLAGVHQRSEKKKNTVLTFNLYSPKFVNTYQTTRCQKLEHKGINMLLHWFDWNLSDYFGSTISVSDRWNARATGLPGPVNAAGTCSLRQTTVSIKRLYDSDSDPSVAWGDVLVIMLPLQRCGRECLSHNGQVFRSSVVNAGHTSLVQETN